MPYVHNNIPQPHNNTYIEYVDVFSQEIVTPTAGVRNFMYYFDTEDGNNPLKNLANYTEVKLYQKTIFYVLKGHCVFEINNKETRIEAGQLLSTMPETMIKFKYASPDIQYRMLVVYPKLLSMVYEDLGITLTLTELTRIYYISKVKPEIMKVCMDLYDEMKADMLAPSYEYKAIYQRSLLNVLFVYNMMAHDFYPQQTHGNSNSRQYDVYRKFLNLLNKHVNDQRSVQFYADQLGISSKYLSFVCISYSKRNASSWIDEYVVQKAQVLMSIHGYSFTEISEILHFQTVSSFSRFFKRVTGMTPKEYYRTVQKK
ncbi:MAG: helix-turn-helix transcriptional regulator [Prevotellaceae bacterium]|nr:helix-turn-helix transcriptional regulator [Candidatus Minthosoma equi]